MGRFLMRRFPMVALLALAVAIVLTMLRVIP